MKSVICFTCCICILLTCNINHADPFMLISIEEARDSNSNKYLSTSKSFALIDAPTIDLIIPKLGSNVISPTPIEIKFSARAPALIKPETFKVFYGTFSIDITNRLQKYAKVTEIGIKVSEVGLPTGNHKITFNVEDTESRIGSKTIELEIK